MGDSAEAPKAGRPAAKKSAPAAKKSGGLRLATPSADILSVIGGPPGPAAGNTQSTGVQSKAAPSATVAGDAWSEGELVEAGRRLVEDAGDSWNAGRAGDAWNAKPTAASVESGVDADNRDPLADFHRKRPGAAEDVQPARSSWSSADWDWKANWK